jgi:hypothetical protein
VNLLGDKRHLKEKHRNFDTSKEVGLEVNREKTKYMLLSHHQNTWQNHDVKIAHTCFENVAQFKYLGMTVSNRNLIRKLTGD